MTRHVDYRRASETRPFPGDETMVFSTSYGSEGVTVHLTDLNSETVLSSHPLTDDDDSTILQAYIALLQDAFESMYG